MRKAIFLGIIFFTITSPAAGQNIVERIIPLPEWAGWWKEAEECSGMRADFAEVTFYAVRDTAFLIKGKFEIGWSDPDTREIFAIADSLRNKRFMQHEFAHQLTKVPGHPDHPFRTCGWLSHSRSEDSPRSYPPP